MASGEKVYKRSSSFIGDCMNTCISLLKVPIKSSFGIKLPKAGSNSCIVLGNGPSLKESLLKHPDFFKKHELVCVNSFSVTEQYKQLQPKYYVMLDPGFWLGDNELVRTTIDHLREKTTWKINLLVPPQARYSALFKEMVEKNANIQISYFNYTVFKGFDRIAHWFFKKNLAMPQSQNVLVASLFLAINIGFKEIYMVGADHTWHEQLHVNDENVLCLKNVHFYENVEQIAYKPFYKGVHTKETFRMDEILVTWGKTFYGYVALNRYASYCDATIYNASEISFIDAFKRIKI